MTKCAHPTLQINENGVCCDCGQSKRFNALQPAAKITNIVNRFALYQQSGQAWLFNHDTGRVWPVAEPLAWLTEEEKIKHAREEVLRGEA